MTVLVTCPNVRGGLFAIEGDRVRRLIPSIEDFRGIARHGARAAVVAREQELWRLSLSPYVCVEKRVAVPWGDLHSLCVVGDQVFVALTGQNAIGIYDAITLEEQQIIPFRPERQDTLHLNSVWISDGVLLTSQFSETPWGGRWRDLPKISGLILSNGRPVIRDVGQPHSIGLLAGTLRYCVSNEGRVIIGSRSIQFDGFTRGVCTDDRYLYVGLSADRVDEFPEPDYARVAVLDLADLRRIRTIDLSDAREIYDLCVVPWVGEWAHDQEMV